MKLWSIFTLTLVLLLLTGCNYVKEKETMNRNEENTQTIITKQHNKSGVEAEYPVFVSGGNAQELAIWNQIIEKDFNKILDIYSFEPFTGPTPAPATQIPTILNLKYKMRLNNDHFASFSYLADFNSAYAAHPTEIMYTTNIDKKNSKRVRLGDIVTLNKDFVKEFRTWDFVPIEQGNEELNQAIKDYFTQLSDEDLLQGFQHADIIGTGNLRDIYSYLTPQKIGISFGVPNYIGDHVEFERNYDSLKKFLKVNING